MQSQKARVVSVVIVLIILVLGGYALFHNPSKKTSSSNTDIIKTVTSPVKTVGSYLISGTGKALYIHTTDSYDHSICTGACLTSWPPYVDTGSTTGLPKNVGTYKRPDDGKLQYTYKRMPLYFYSGDKQGQINGNGLSAFYVAKP